jgi:hypothetical protein
MGGTVGEHKTPRAGLYTFVNVGGWGGRKKIFVRRWRTGVSRVASSCAAGTLFRRPLDKVYIRLLMLLSGS